MVGGSGLPATIERVIAVKNRSHNPKSTDTKLQSFFFDQTGRFSAQPPDKKTAGQAEIETLAM